MRVMESDTCIGNLRAQVTTQFPNTKIISGRSIL